MSLRRTDLLTLSHLRNDGRAPNEIRHVKIQISPLPQTSSGSALVHMGLTAALASATGPAECQRASSQLSDRAILTVNLKIAPFAPADRRVVNPNTDRRCLEQARAIEKALEAAVLLHLYPRASIEVDVVVLADDGGRLCTAINAATLALIDAGIAMKDMVCACSAGVSGDEGSETIVDLNRSEMMGGVGESAVYLPCAIMPQRGTIVLAQCESRLGLKSFERVLEAAVDGCEVVFGLMRKAVRERAGVLLAAKSGGISIDVDVPR
eukprot:CAMPEP_0172485574 /NCGR_PEP_ID=MMETSP1066-20121228/13653_1 /TAXON_ID=671091 /ORGANISM="Coscinodiscus wailesii, Strain CCMP2513" /LENGTH=265 /DNA_ID=CAMNT_0013250907 /DNA_START=98 /DNA_END=895 /DNA_ORIENTATION=-